MMKNYKDVEKRVGNVRMTTLAFKVLFYVSVALSVVGIIYVIGIGGSIDIGRLTFEQGMKQFWLGILFTGVALVASVAFSVLAEKCAEEDEFKFTADEVLGYMAFSERHESWIVVIGYKHDRDWKYCLCDHKGRPTSSPIRTNMLFTRYTWK